MTCCDNATALRGGNGASHPLREKRLFLLLCGVLLILAPAVARATSEKTTISVTDPSPWFTKGCNSGGSCPYWWSHTYNGHSYISTYVGGMISDPSQPDYWAMFKPYLSQSGKYDVYACFYACENTSTKVPFTVKYDGGLTTIKVNQYSSSPTWKEKYLGTWDFQAGSDTYVKVTDATGEAYDGITGLTIGAIKFVKVNQPPACSLSANPRSGNAPLTVTFSMSASDPDGSISVWGLDVDGDGNAEYSGADNPPSTQTHTYTTPGSYSVVLAVLDNDGANAVDTETIVVGENDPPTCFLSPDTSSGKAPLTITFSISASDSDGWISSWELSAGDGSPTYSGSGNPPSIKTHTYTSAGTYTAILGVTDNGGATTFDTKTISVSPAAQLPSVSTLEASDIDLTSVTLNGNLDSTGGETCQVWFEWGLTTSYGNSTSKQSKTSAGSFSKSISGLSSGTTYHFRACASNSKGTVYSSDASFTTLSLIQETGSLSTEITRLKTLIFPKDSMLYVEPTASELTDFRALAMSLLNSDWEGALTQATALGYELVDYYDTDTSRHYYLLREELNEFGQQNLGWGSYIWDPYQQADVLVEVPHPLYDMKTPEFAIEVFQDICGRALLMAGAHRAAMGDGIYGIANVAGQEDCIFQIVHETWSEPTTLPIQIHGFDWDDHTDFPVGTDVVLSNGDGAVPQPQIDLDQALGGAGLLSYVYNTLPMDDPVNILVNGDVPGSTFFSLSAGYNVQGQYTRNTYDAPWIHCELEQSVRFNDPSKWQPTVAAIVEALSISSAPDYPAAVWNPADPTNYTVSARPNTYPIMYVIIHVAEGSYSGTIDWLQDPSSDVSAHYVVKSSDGEITQMVRHKDIAWHAENWDYNTWSIGIEHEGYINDPSWFTDQMYESSAALTSYICDFYGIPKIGTYIIGHNEVPGATHTDPGPYWDWDYYMQLVTSLAGDINGDGKVDFTDFAILSSQWLQPPGEPSADIAPEGGDGVVDFFDLNVVTQHWLEGF